MKAKVWISWNSKELKFSRLSKKTQLDRLTMIPTMIPWWSCDRPGSRTNATTNVFSRNTWRVACGQCRMPMGTRCMADRWRSAWGVDSYGSYGLSRSPATMGRSMDDTDMTHLPFPKLWSLIHPGNWDNLSLWNLWTTNPGPIAPTSMSVQQRIIWLPGLPPNPLVSPHFPC